MASSGPLLTLHNITRCYEAPDGGGALTVLEGISLEVGKGESLAIVGPSGSGKSTLLHIIGTLDQPTSGEVVLDGQDLGQLDEVRLAAVRNRQLGFVFQAHYLLPQCTVLENVLVPSLRQAVQLCEGCGRLAPSADLLCKPFQSARRIRTTAAAAPGHRCIVHRCFFGGRLP